MKHHDHNIRKGGQTTAMVTITLGFGATYLVSYPMDALCGRLQISVGYEPS